MRDLVIAAGAVSGVLLAGVTVAWLGIEKDIETAASDRYSEPEMEQAASAMAELHNDIDGLRAELEGLRSRIDSGSYRDAGQDHVADSQAEDLTSLRESVRELVTQVSQLSRSVTTADDPAVTVATNTEPPNWDDVLSLPQLHLEQEQAYFGEINYRYAMEEADPGWASATREYIGNALYNDEFATVQVNAIECKATLCRIEVAGSAEQPLEHLELFLAQNLGDLHPRFSIQYTGDGTVDSAVVFLARDGHGLSE